MIRSIFRSIQSRLEEKKAKGNNEDVVQFFSEKLDLDEESVKKLLDANPQLYKCRLRRVGTPASIFCQFRNFRNLKSYNCFLLILGFANNRLSDK